MLNRRILRVKAMQSLYGFFLVKSSLQKAIGDNLVGKYNLDPAIHDFSDRDLIEEKQRRILEEFNSRVKGSRTSLSFEAEEDKDIESAVDSYNNELRKESSRVKKYVIEEAENIYTTFLKVMLIPGVFKDLEDKEKSKEKQSKSTNSWNFNLIINQPLLTLMDLPELRKAAGRPESNWNSDEYLMIKRWYKEILSQSEEYKRYQELSSPNSEEHLNVLKFIFKHILFKNEIIESDFTEKDLHWAENKSILKNLALKTIKSFDGDNFELKSLSHNQEEDFSFFQNLFKETLTRNDELEETIRQYAKNWDLERIANLDMVLLKLALTEMMSFPSIPVKVTINEYIDISKSYSTPKSKQFINGILDVISNKLTSEGVIKKSGRGLIDNK